MHTSKRSISYRIGALGLVMSLGVAAVAVAQERSGVVDKRDYTEAELDRRQPRWPNPYLSLLPADAEPDWDYWRAKLRLEGRRRAAQRAAIPKAIPVFDEIEPGDARGWNDDQASAEFITGFGTGDGDLREVDVTGTMAAAAPIYIGDFTEEGGLDDGAIPLANEINIEPGQRIRASAYIGDGLHGSNGTRQGDYDVFKFDNLRPGQMVTIDIDTPENASPRLHNKVALYDSTGEFVDYTDSGGPGSPDAFLEVTIEAPGDYFVFVRGVESAWPADPFDPDSGPKVGSEGAYLITLGLDAGDIDYYSLDLEAGDVLGIRLEDEARKLTLYDPSGVELIGSDVDGSYLYPFDTPLPGGGNANAAYLVNTTGRYALAAERGDGAYTMALRVFRPAFEMQDVVQVLFLDFDGEVYDAETYFGGNQTAQLSPMVSYLDNVGLDPTPGGADENAVIDAILAVVEENLVDDIHTFGLNRDYQIEILNSRDHADPFGAPNVSRVIVGGDSEEFGRPTVGIAESVDVGNFDASESAVVLMDLLTEPGTVNSLHQVTLDAGTSIIDLMGTALGHVIVHEAGHLFANFHTGRPDFPVNLMDGNPNLLDFIGIGPDDVFGTGDDKDIDFGLGGFHPDFAPGFTGVQDTRNTIAFGLSGLGEPVVTEPATPGVPEGFELSASYPNPFNEQTRFVLRLRRAQPVHLAVYDMLGRQVRLLHEGWLPAGETHVFTLDAGSLPSGLYMIRGAGPTASATRPVMLVR